MAEIEKKEFKFPDEVENEEKEQVEVEVEDDTPEKDRNVETLTKEIK